MQANSETDKSHKKWITDTSNTCRIRHQNQKPNNITFIIYGIIFLIWWRRVLQKQLLNYLWNTPPLMEHRSSLYVYKNLPMVPMLS